MFTPDKKLGIAPKKHTYDIPFHKDAGAGVLIGVIAVMGVLVGAIVMGGIIMHGKTKHWVTGVDHLATIEIPAIDADGSPLDDDVTNRAQTTVEALPFIQSVTVKTPDDVADMLIPWLGQNAMDNTDVLPIPTLLSVTLQETASDTDKQGLIDTVNAIHPAIQIDFHGQWTQTIHRILTLVYTGIGGALALIMAVSALVMMMALNMRLMIYKKDIELLHLMGARNRYITRQFTRHAGFMMIKGLGIAGILCAIAALTLLHMTHGSGFVIFVIGLITIYGIIGCIVTANTKRTVQKYIKRIGI